MATLRGEFLGNLNLTFLIFLICRVQASKPKSPEPSLNLINFENSLSPTPKRLSHLLLKASRCSYSVVFRDSRIELKRPEKTADLIYNTSPPTHIENVQLAKALEPKIFVTEDIGVGPSEVNRLIANDLISLKADAVSAVCSCVLPTIHSPTSLLTKNHSASIKSFFLEFGVSAESCTNAAQSVYDSSEICHN